MIINTLYQLKQTHAHALTHSILTVTSSLTHSLVFIFFRAMDLIFAEDIEDVDAVAELGLIADLQAAIVAQVQQPPPPLIRRPIW